MSLAHLGLASSLTDLLRMRHTPVADLIVDELFPRVEVTTEEGKFLDIDGAFGVNEDLGGFYRADNAEYGRALFNVASSSGWQLRNWGLSTLIDRAKAKAANGVGLAYAEGMMMALRARFELVRERQAAALAFAAGSWGSNTSAMVGGAQLSDLGTDVIGQAEVAHEAIRQGTGHNANTVVVDHKGFTYLQRISQIINGVSPTQRTAGRAYEEDILRALGVERILVGKAVYNSARAGQSQSMANVWGNSLLFAYITEDPAPTAPQSATGRFELAGGDDEGFNRQVSILDGVSHTNLDIAVGAFEDLKISRSASGYLYTNTY